MCWSKMLWNLEFGRCCCLAYIVNRWCWVFAALGGPTETCQAGSQQGEGDGTSEPTHDCVFIYLFIIIIFVQVILRSLQFGECDLSQGVMVFSTTLGSLGVFFDIVLLLPNHHVYFNWSFWYFGAIFADCFSCCCFCPGFSSWKQERSSELIGWKGAHCKTVCHI